MFYRLFSNTRVGVVIDTSTWGLGIHYDHKAEFGLALTSFVTISILCLHILIIIKEEPRQ